VQALSCQSPEDLERWTIEHSESINDVFFAALATWSERARSEGHGIQADLIQATGDLVRAVLDKDKDFKHQLELLQSVFQTTTRVEYHERLRTILPEITSAFFVTLGDWVDESTCTNDAGITLCKDLFDLIDFNDLREDWGELERTIIWGSAWFIKRHDVFFRKLFDPENAGQPLVYKALRDALKSAFLLAQRGNIASLVLATLNVILEVTSGAVDGLPTVPQADELRFYTLLTGARVIILRGKANHIANARQVLGEAQTVFDKLVVKQMDQEDCIWLNTHAAARLNVLGDLARRDDNPEEAIHLQRQALQQHKAAIEDARAKGLSEAFIRRVAWGVPNSLRDLAKAELKLWRLDEACDHFEHAIIEYRGLGMSGCDLAGHLRSLARAEFLRTNFARAEALLDEAARLEQEAKPG
jgi:tetratricopeptide (TPR) repeat protein